MQPHFLSLSSGYDPGVTPQVSPLPCWLPARSQIPVFSTALEDQTFKRGKEGREEEKKGRERRRHKRMERLGGKGWGYWQGSENQTGREKQVSKSL